MGNTMILRMPGSHEAWPELLGPGNSQHVCCVPGEAFDVRGAPLKPVRSLEARRAQAAVCAGGHRCSAWCTGRSQGAGLSAAGALQSSQLQGQV